MRYVFKEKRRLKDLSHRSRSRDMVRQSVNDLVELMHSETPGWIESQNVCANGYAGHLMWISYFAEYAFFVLGKQV